LGRCDGREVSGLAGAVAASLRFQTRWSGRIWRSRVRLVPFAALALAGCGGEPPPEAESPEPVGEVVQADTVAQATQNGCSTASVKALATQVVDEANCLVPGAYVEVPAQPNVDFGSAVFPYLEQPARDAFVSAVQAHAGTTMTVNSMLRTVVQQYMLYRWYLNSQCGIGLAAKPGASNHETGLAFDVQEHATWQAALEAVGFQWLGASDPVHFDYAGPDAVDHKGTDALAFQKLWNLNNPGDLIAEDGAYGPQTQARIEQSPAGGFAKGASCAPPPAGKPDIWPSAAITDAEDVFSDHASKGVPDVFEGEAHHAWLAVVNKGDAPGKTVNVGVSVAAPWLGATTYLVESDWTHPGTFTENDSNTSPDNPPHDKPPGATFTLHLGQLSPGETKRVTLGLTAEKYSIGLAASPDVRFWVEDVDDRYHQPGYGDAPTNDGSQTFAGGTLQVSAPLDVYSHTHWEWDGGLLEGFTPVGGATLTPDANAKVLVIDASGDGPGALGPKTAIPADGHGSIALRAKRTGGVGASRLYFTTDASPAFGEDKVLPLDLPDDGQFHELAVVAAASPAWTGSVTELRLAPFDSGQGTVEVDYLRVGDGAPAGAGGGGGAGGAGLGGAASEGGGGSAGLGGGASAGMEGQGAPDEPAAANAGCGCNVPGSRGATSSTLATVLASVLLGVRARRRARSARRAGSK
jgi:hypothetical protein